MTTYSFQTVKGVLIPTVTADEMREVDRIAMDEFGMDILQLMENAGRNLASVAQEMLADEGLEEGRIIVLAGGGNNGGGGLCAARHLDNRGFQVSVLLDRPSEELTGAAADQYSILTASGLNPVDSELARNLIGQADLVIDALLGYGLEGTPRGETARLIALTNARAREILSLDVPSGVDATTGKGAALAIRPTRTVTLALPKTGLVKVPGEIYLANIGIPAEVFAQAGVPFDWPFGTRFWGRIKPVPATSQEAP